LRETTTQKLTSLQDKQQVKHHTFHFNFAPLRETTTQKLTSLQDKQQVKHHTFHFNFAPLRLCEKPQLKN